MSKIDNKKVSKKNQLHEFIEYDTKNILFADPVEGTVPGVPGSYYRINILAKNAKLTQNEDGNFVPEFTTPVLKDDVVVTEPEMIMSDTIGDFMVTFDKMFSFGVAESIDPTTQKVTGHSMSLSLYSKDGATEREIKTVDKLETFIERCRLHLLSVCKLVKKPKLLITDLKDMGKLLYWKLDDDGEKVPGMGPTFSPKLVEYKASVDSKGVEKPYQMITTFYLEDEVDDEGNPKEVDPLTFLSDNKNKKFKLCYVRPVIKFDSIFIGGKSISIQCKITEADITSVQVGSQRLLHNRHKFVTNSKSNSSSSSGVNPLLSGGGNSNKDEDSDEEEEKDEHKEKQSVQQVELKDEPPVVKKKIIKKKKESE